MNSYTSYIAKVALAALAMSGTAQATVTIFPQASLTPNGNYYTTDLGTVMVTTGGGNAANVGAADGRNDDGFRGQISLASLGFSAGYTFFGIPETQLFINNNGNVSFGAGISAYTPNGPQGATSPIISPFFADVDTRDAASGVVYYSNPVPGELIVTWDAVGYFGAHADKTDSFQLVLRDPAVYNIPIGEGAIGFFWKTMGWETGDASGGSGGFGGTPAAVGFGDGSSNGVVLQGSTANGIAAVVQNHDTWFNQNLTPVCGVPGTPACPTPEPETFPLLAIGLLGLIGTFCRRKLASKQ